MEFLLCFVFVSAQRFYKSKIFSACDQFLHIFFMLFHFTVRWVLLQTYFKPHVNEIHNVFLFSICQPSHHMSIKPKCAKAISKWILCFPWCGFQLQEAGSSITGVSAKDDEVFSAYLSCFTSLGDCMNDCSCHGDRAGFLKGSHEEMERDEQKQIIVKRPEQPWVEFRAFKE